MNRRRFVVSSLAVSLAQPLVKSVFAADAQAAPLALAGDALTPAMQKQLAQDPLRPQFHLLPQHNWMNDPCAPRFHRGEYHMFFQYNPHAAVWGDMHWNHATSPDLIHWKHQPVALAPTRGSYDSFGCFTGSVLPDGDRVSILYTGVTRSTPEQETIRGEGIREVQCLATASDAGLGAWHKLDKPVIDAPPPGVKVTGFRDPCPWKVGDTWYLIVGSGFEKVGGAVLLYTSKDGRAWTYLHPLAQGTWNGGSQTNPVDTGEMWECPDFFPLGGKHVLLYSTERKVYWEVGTLDTAAMRFHSETRGLLDHGSYYAMKSMADAEGRRVLWGWVTETRPAEDCVRAGWAGAMALPRVLTVGGDNQLRMEVPAEFAALRQRPESQSKGSGAALAVPGRAAEALWTFRAGPEERRLELRPAGGGAARVTLTGSGADLTVHDSSGQKTLALMPGGEGLSTVRMWIDGSVIEIFVDGREVVTLRDYSAGGLELAATGADALVVYGVRPISSNRLTT